MPLSQLGKIVLHCHVICIVYYGIISYKVDMQSLKWTKKRNEVITQNDGIVQSFMVKIVRYLKNLYLYKEKSSSLTVKWNMVKF